MQPQSVEVMLKLRKVIARFNIEELKDAVLPSFPELTWKKLRSLLMRNHEGLTVPAALRVIEQTIRDAEIGNQDLRNRLSTLELIEVSRHSRQRDWICYKLQGQKRISEFRSDSEIQETLSESFSALVQPMIVLVTTHDDITFVSIKERRPGKKQRLYPVYFAFPNGQKYFFTSKKSVHNDCLTALSTGLGYASCKLAKLSGRDLKSLIKLLQGKEQAAINHENILEPPIYTASKPVIGKTGIDFTQSKQRGEHIDKFYGPDPPTTELLEVTFADQPWKCTDLVPEMENEVLDFKVEFRSQNIPDMMKDLVQRRIIQMPLPRYAEDMLTIGENHMKFRPNLGNSS